MIADLYFSLQTRKSAVSDCFDICLVLELTQLLEP